FFCFPAEDGIRYFHVTGVQTCALPIYPNRYPALKIKWAFALKLPFEMLRKLHLQLLMHRLRNKQLMVNPLMFYHLNLVIPCIAFPWLLLLLEWLAFLLQKTGEGFLVYLRLLNWDVNNRFFLRKMDRLSLLIIATSNRMVAIQKKATWHHLYNKETHNLEVITAFLKLFALLHALWK